MRKNRTVSSRITMTTMLVAIALCAVAGPPYTGESDGPGVLYSSSDPSEHPYPIWVSAAELVKGGGELDWALLGEHAAEAWRSREPLTKRRSKTSTTSTAVSEVEEADCDVMHNRLTWQAAVDPEDHDLYSLIEGSQLAFAGKVTDRTPGFFVGALATLLTVEVSETFRVEAPKESPPVFYVIYPQARFAAGGQVFCGQHQSGPDAPRIGTNLVILNQLGPIDQQGLLLKVTVEEVIADERKGALVLPPKLEQREDLRDLDWEGLLGIVRRAFEGSTEPGERSELRSMQRNDQ